MTERIKNVFSFLARFAFSAALLVYLFLRIVDVDKTIAVVKSADLGQLFFAFLVYSVIYIFILRRWDIFIKALGCQVSFFNMVRYFFIGLFGNLFLPSAIGGDVIKTIGLCGSSDQKPKIVASVLLDRLSGFGGMTVVATLSFLLGYRYINDLSLAVMIIVMAGTSGTLAFILFNERIYAFGTRIFGFWPRFREALMNMHYDIVLLKDRKKTIIKAVFISCVCQTILAATTYLIAKALHQDIRFIYFLIFIPLVCVASCFPSIGGLGVREAGFVFLFAKVGVASDVSVSISLLTFLFMVLVGLLGGAFFVLTKPAKKTGK